MISPISKKKLENIDLKDIQSLIDNKIPESYDIDYKQDYPNNKKLAKRIIGFANASGGYIIVGIKEKKIKVPNTNKEGNTGLPEKIVGIPKGDHSIKITQIMLAHSQPKIIPQIHFLEIAPDKDIVIIKINEAVEPIMYYHANDKDSNKFYIRINDKIEPADQPLLKKLFTYQPFYGKIQEMQKAVFSNQEEIYRIYEAGRQERQYILLGILIIPFNKNLEILNIRSEKIEFLIQDLYKSLNLNNPFQLMLDFSRFLRSFNYMGDYFRCYFVDEGQEHSWYNHSELNIFGNGIFKHNIIYQTVPIASIHPYANNLYFLEENKKLLFEKAPFLMGKLLIYLFACWIKVAKILFEEGQFKGKFFLNFRIKYKDIISLGFGNYSPLSHTNDIKIVKTIEYFDITEEDSLQILLNELFREVLRYFGFKLSDIGDKLDIFEDLIKEYIDFILS